MSPRVPIIERAYELAKSGDHRTVGTIKDALKRQGYVMVDAHIAGASLIGALRRHCLEAGALGPGRGGQAPPSAPEAQPAAAPPP